MILPVIILAQAGFSYSDDKGDLSLRARDGQGEMTANGYQFDLRGGVTITSTSRKFSVKADRVLATVAKGGQESSPNTLEKAVATGNVRIQQSVDGRSASLQSQSATYLAKGDAAEIQAKGMVRIQNIDSGKKETMLATGTSGTATLDPKSKRGISKATLAGPVRIELKQANSQGTTIVFTGNRLTLAGNTVALVGNVKATGSGASRFGNLSNVDSLTVELNDRGEMSRFRFKAGGSR
jgi:lipopolysaccharide assembly outer membrane protein LptD (OstA)